MSEQFNIETKCIQSGWKPKRENRESFRFIRVRHLSTIQANRWDVCLTWKTADISTQDCRIRQ